MCFQWAEEWQLCTGRCDYWHITQSEAAAAAAAASLYFCEWNASCSGRVLIQRMYNKRQVLRQAARISPHFPKTCSLPADSECRLVVCLTQIFNPTPPAICPTETCWCVLVPLRVGTWRNLTGLCYGWALLLYSVNRHNCWSFPGV